MTNYVNFKLSKDVEKNPGPSQYNTDHHEVIIRPFMQNHSSTMRLISPISSENLMHSRLGQPGLQSIDVGGAGDCFFRSVSHQLYGNSSHHNFGFLLLRNILLLCNRSEHVRKRNLTA